MPDPSKSTYATGRRKHAVARVWLQPGNGKVDINRRTLEDYFGRETSRMVFRQALELTETTGRFDVFVNVSGGGLSGQADAIRHGISRVLTKIDPTYRPAQEGRLPDARRARQRAQEVRPARRPRPLPVQQALKRLLRGRGFAPPASPPLAFRRGAGAAEPRLPCLGRARGARSGAGTIQTIAGPARAQRGFAARSEGGRGPRAAASRTP